MKRPPEEDEIEKLSAELHAIYQAEAKRQYSADLDYIRHPDDYDALDEHTKEYDRVLARFILARESDLRAVLVRIQDWDLGREYGRGLPNSLYDDIDKSLKKRAG